MTSDTKTKDFYYHFVNIDLSCFLLGVYKYHIALEPPDLSSGSAFDVLHREKEALKN